MADVKKIGVLGVEQIIIEDVYELVVLVVNMADDIGVTISKQDLSV